MFFDIFFFFFSVSGYLFSIARLHILNVFYFNFLFFTKSGMTNVNRTTSVLVVVVVVCGVIVQLVVGKW